MLTGTGPDASTVAFVKTVRPDQHDLFQEFRDDEKNRYQEVHIAKILQLFYHF